MANQHSFGYKVMDFLFQGIAVRQYLIFSASFLAVTAIVMYLLDAQMLPPGCPGMLSLELAFTKGAFTDIVRACGVDGVGAHQVMIWVDYIFIFAYTGFLANLLGSLVRHLEYEKALRYFSVAIYAGLFDVIENTLLLIELSDTSSVSGALVFITSLVALIKFALIALTIGLCIYFLYGLMSKKSHA